MKIKRAGDRFARQTHETADPFAGKLAQVEFRCRRGFQGQHRVKDVFQMPGYVFADIGSGNGIAHDNGTVLDLTGCRR